MNPYPLYPSFSEFAELAKRGNLVPVYTEFVADYETPLSVLEKIDDDRRSFLFESAELNDQVGRYSILGSQPRVYFESRGAEILIEENGRQQRFSTDSDPLAELKRLMGRYRAVPLPNLPPFTGGAVGYIGFDVVRFFEPTVPPPPPDTLQLPDSVFMITDNFLVFDHRFRRLKIVALAVLDGQDPEAAYREAGAK